MKTGLHVFTFCRESRIEEVSHQTGRLIPEHWWWEMLLDHLEAFIEAARSDNAVLERNGAIEAARARANLLAELEEALALFEDETVTVAEAAQLTGVNEETVRRAVRNGEIADTRENPNGIIHVRRGDLERLRGKVRNRNRSESSAQNAVAALIASA